MIASLAASAAIFAASALAGGVGSGIVINSCAYDVHLSAVPSSGGGQTQSDTILKSGGTWSQQWTQLTNTMGWSIKLSKTAVMSNIMQYEYTYHGDNTIWYDLSEVDGNPWRGNFMITAQSDGNKCTPRQAAYRYSTDDAYGMQDCAASSVITVELCSGDNAAAPVSSIVSSVVSSVVSQSAAVPAPPPESTTAVAVKQPSSSVPVQVNAAAVVQSTTFSTSHVAASSTTKAPVVEAVYTTYETVTMTDVVTIDMTVTAYASPAPRRRHEHHHGRHAGHN